MLAERRAGLIGVVEPLECPSLNESAVEALDFAVGLRPVGPGPLVCHAELCAGVAPPPGWYTELQDAQMSRGVLLVADRDETVVQYVLQSSTTPVALSRYELPEEVRQLLPAEEQLREVGRHLAADWEER